MSILEEICLHQQELVNRLKVEVPVSELEKQPGFLRKGSSVKQRFLTSNGPGLITEFKRRSPSIPSINLSADPVEVVTGYEMAGAFAASILTNEKYFGGSAADLQTVRARTELPLLRKDFIVDEYQVYETKAMGADIMLLIAASLSPEQVYDFAKLAKEIGLEVLLELKDESEIAHINSFVDLVGVNNRDLSTFKVDVGMSERVGALIPDEFIKVSESGISDVDVVKRLSNKGFRGFLIGEHFMRQPDPALACYNFIDKL